MSLTIARTTVTAWRRLPRVVWMLVLARAVNRLGAFTLPFLSVTLVSELGASVPQAGALMAAFGVATIPSRLLGGRLVDRCGPRSTIVLGLAGTAVGQLAVAASTSLVHACAAALLLGLAFEVYEPPSQALIADATTDGDRPVAFGLLAAALAAGGMGAGLLAAALAGLDLRWLFVADAASCLGCAVLVGTGLRSSPASSPASSSASSRPLRSRRPRRDAAAGPWRDPRLLLLLALGTAFAVVYLQVTIILPLTVTSRGLPVAVVGLLLTVSAATVVLGQPLLTAGWLRRRDDLSAMAIGYVVLATGLLFTGLATSLAAYVVATVVWSVGDLLLMGRALSLVAGVAPESGRAPYLAVYGTSWGLAAVVAPLLGTQLLARAGPTATWCWLAVACLLLAAAYGRARGLLGPPRRDRTSHSGALARRT